jgi:hypothetical protein
MSRACGRAASLVDGHPDGAVSDGNTYWAMAQLDCPDLRRRHCPLRDRAHRPPRPRARCEQQRFHLGVRTLSCAGALPGRRRAVGLPNVPGAIREMRHPLSRRHLARRAQNHASPCVNNSVPPANASQFRFFAPVPTRRSSRRGRRTELLFSSVARNPAFNRPGRHPLKLTLGSILGSPFPPLARHSFSRRQGKPPSLGGTGAVVTSAPPDSLAVSIPPSVCLLADR